MSEKHIFRVPMKIRTYLNEIAERLSQGSAAIMVGAGFSKNASTSFPSWNELGDLFFKKLNGEEVNSKDNYLSILKLAEQVEAAFGRPTLEGMLRDAIPDIEYEPSSLHVKLLELPWADVFTTNYDTLLERACSAVTSQRYDVVINKEDLVYSKKPRIVKLHGSFPSQRPSIITEEDYRKYPKDFAPFVNTVQQALLENTLCLIGFSGDDPNFLQWIGWIHDNLGNTNCHKLYLVGVLSLSDSQKKVLEKRNIAIVDLSECPQVEDDHYKGLELFLDYLSLERAKENRLGWPETSELLQPINQKDKIQQIDELISLWKEQRLSYPGWVVVPENRRSSLWDFTKFWIDFVSEKDNLPQFVDLQFSFELNWRIEKCLVPLSNEQASLFEKILDTYLPPSSGFIPPQSLKESYQKTDGDLDIKNPRRMSYDILLSLMRYYREGGLLDKWKEYHTKIKREIKYLSGEQKAKLNYENCLFELFKLHLPELKRCITEWRTNDSLPFWQAKRASLLAEIGQVNEAAKILEQSLKNIRSYLNLKPITTDYSLVSQESYVMLLLRYINNFSLIYSVKKATINEEQIIKRRFQEEWENRRSNSNEGAGSLDAEWNQLYDNREGDRRQDWMKKLIEIRSEFKEKETKKYRERWNILKQYHCDPWNDIKYFEGILERPAAEKKKVTINPGFDIGRFTRTSHLGDSDEDALVGYGFLRLFEDVGLPFRIPGSSFGKKSAEGAILRISKYSPYWAMATMIRIADEKAVDHVFNRESLSEMSPDVVDSLIETYLRALILSAEDIKEGNRFYRDNFGIILAGIIPEILSRLCSKCSLKYKNKLLDFLMEVYKSDYRGNYTGINHLTQRLIKAFSVRQRYNMITTLLDFPIIEHAKKSEEREFFNPIRSVNIDKEVFSNWKKPKIHAEKIDPLLKYASSNDSFCRDWAIQSLYELYELNLLNKNQSSKFGIALWSRLDNLGFPAHNNFYKFAFIELPHPPDIDVVSLFKDYVMTSHFPIQNKNGKKGISFSGGPVPICQEIIRASKIIQWPDEEIAVIFSRIVEWWDTDKDYLKQKRDILFGSVGEEFKDRLSELVDVLTEAIVPNLHKNLEKDKKDTLLRLINEQQQCGLSTIRLQSACLHIFPEWENAIYNKIKIGLASEDIDFVTDSLRAVFIAIERIKNNESKQQIGYLFSMLGQMIFWQKRTGLPNVLFNFGKLIKPHFSLFVDEVEKFTLIGLKNIAEDTKRSKDGLEFSENLHVRKVAAGLAFELYMNYCTHNKPIPDVIKKWELICKSENEFAEIRNQWIYEIDA